MEELTHFQVEISSEVVTKMSKKDIEIFKAAFPKASGYYEWYRLPEKDVTVIKGEGPRGSVQILMALAHGHLPLAPVTQLVE